AKNELLEFPQKRLVFENRKTADHVKARSKWRTDDTALENSLQGSNRSLPSPILMNKKRDARLPTNSDHLLGPAKCRRHGLLTDPGKFVPRGQVDKLAVGAHIGNDVDEIDLLSGEQFLGIIIDRRYRKAPGERFSFRACPSVNRDAFRAFELLPG